jgi:hypothetical protein
MLAISAGAEKTHAHAEPPNLLFVVHATKLPPDALREEALASWYSHVKPFKSGSREARKGDGRSER